MHLQERPQDVFLETLYRRQVIKSTEFQQTMTLYNLENVQKGGEPSYTRLYEMVVAFLNDKRIQRNVGKSQGSGAAAKHGGPTQGDCPQFYKTGKCSRKPCPYSHNTTTATQGPSKGKGKGDPPKGKGKGKDKGNKGDERGRSRTRQEPQASREDSRNKHGQPTRGRSPSGKAERKQCFKYMRGECPNGKKCDYWHPPPCRDGKKCKLGKECMFYHPAKATPAKDSDKSDDDTETTKKKKKKRDKTPPVVKAQIAIQSPLNHQGSTPA